MIFICFLISFLSGAAIGTIITLFAAAASAEERKRDLEKFLEKDNKI